MSKWDPTELNTIAEAEQLNVAPLRTDGTPRAYTTTWVVRVGDDLYVRSWRGRKGGWFRHALQTQEGRIQAGDLERDVALEEAEDADHRAIDDAYRTKYARYASGYVQPMVSPVATAATLRLVPRRG